tara:strand:+ start:3856 stop:4419 length:564 start_codon:yes stop_codon:yes gene_type:complete
MKPSKLTEIITNFTLYKFIDALTTPFTRMPAYSMGIIDANGKQLKSVEQLSQKELQQFTPFEQLIVSLKRLLVKVPDPYVRAHLTNVPAALALFTEECEKAGGNGAMFLEGAMRELRACGLLQEDGEGAAAPIANSVGAGGVAGMKPDDLGVPVSVQKRIQQSKGRYMARRKNQKTLDTTGESNDTN